ncbi:grasp-with-spasm system SPASM domain peptide maturase [Aureispira sp. CCB-QB1]|uniref:grasp-with-spasm system SPASM domain peptide maturase n=1 Tax=Aureispira sp. CCB-QB1 TaxID=1313421 RepID=UPI000698E425|nr:grasp-with-spasm system SPASM domain peptide maturase [Aureispira sp. CCB-QB1]
MKNYFMLYANCIIVKGISRGIITDLQHLRYKLIPLLLADILEVMSKEELSIDEVKQQFNNEYNKGIDLFLENLIEEGYGIKTDDISFFPKLPLDYDYPAKISNAIVDLNKLSTYHVKNIGVDLNILGVKAVEIRFFDPISLEKINSILTSFELTGIRSIELLIQYSTFWTVEKIHQIFINQRRVQRIILASAPEDKEVQSEFLDIFWITKAVKSSNCCGLVGFRYFNPNMKHFTESQHHNTCLNRKISIDTQGRIKNCPSMQQSFGHINDTTLEEVIQNPAFTKVWNIKKDEIEKCKGCEFRHICTDCRAYLENPEDVYAAPLKCGYNPETCEWEDWSTNPLKEKAIEYYQLQSTF